ncbi:MAG: adenosine kinase [Candidatus Peregrinibacteria bacterium Greene0416_19]|nr:MAG: adenosine kinase [Candidatus Peregrinibacteria bacterium Greene0416_19]
MLRMKKILVTGSIAYDVLLGYDGSFADAIDPSDLDHLSVSFFSPHYARHHGGTAANIAWNLRLLLQEPLLVGTVGSDGGSYLALMRERGIDTSMVEELQEHVTATAIIGTDDAERQIAFFHPGADAHGAWPDLSELREDIAYAVIGARNPALMMTAVRWCQVYGVPYLFDPGQQVIALSSDELLAAVKGSAGVIANAYEWSLLSAKIGLSTGALLELAPMLIVTQGEEGVTIYRRKEPAIVLRACPPQRFVNPTGAGDAFRAGLLTGLLTGWSLEHCGMLGASIASFVVEQEGTLLDFLDVNDVLGRAEVTYGEVLPEIR